jgi:hypothetical protein
MQIMIADMHNLIRFPTGHPKMSTHLVCRK